MECIVPYLLSTAADGQRRGGGAVLESIAFDRCHTIRYCDGGQGRTTLETLRGNFGKAFRKIYSSKTGTLHERLAADGCQCAGQVDGGEIRALIEYTAFHLGQSFVQLHRGKSGTAVEGKLAERGDTGRNVH